jgi:hypothetical protein
MFEKIVLRRSEREPALTVGEIAEALLFYQNVHLVLDHGTLNGLLDIVEMEQLLELLARPNVSAVYCEEVLGTQTERVGAFELHGFIAFILSGHQDIGNLPSRKKRLEFILERKGYDKKRARRLVERFRSHVSMRKLTDDYFLPGGIVNAASGDLHDPSFVNEAIRRVVANTVGAPPLLGEFKFEITHMSGKFLVSTNLDLNHINSVRRGLGSEIGDVSVAHLVNEILMAKADTAFAAHYGGDFLTSALTSQIVRLRYSELLRRAGISSDELQQFHEVILPESPSIREVINSGERSFDEFLVLLDKSQRFREWTQGVSPDEKIVSAYLKDATSQGWIQKLPSKTLRYIIGSIVGAVSPSWGLGVSAVDSFLLEKILGGWRPSHFIDNKLKPFLGGKAETD